MYELKLATAITIPFFAFDANGDGITGKVDGDWTKRISKGGGAFAAMTVTITEMENGWYSLPIGTSHVDTPGILSVSLSATGVKRVNLQWRVSTRIIDNLAFPSVENRPIDVDVTGGVEITPNQNVNVNQWLTATPAALTASGFVQAMLLRWLTDNAAGTPSALATNRVVTRVEDMANDVVTAAAIAVNAIGASELAADAAQEVADEFLNRNLAGGGSGGARIVRGALRALRNRRAIAAGTLTVYQEDDTTPDWTGAVTTTAGNPVSQIDPA